MIRKYIPLLLLLLFFYGCSSANYSEFTYHDFASAFAEAFVQNDVGEAGKLKSAFRGYYDELLLSLQKRINNEAVSEKERSTIAQYFAWCVMIP